MAANNSASDALYLMFFRRKKILCCALLAVKCLSGSLNLLLNNILYGVLFIMS